MQAEKLESVGKEVASIVGDSNVVVVETDVSKLDQVVRLKDKVYELWDEVRIITSGPTQDAHLKNHLSLHLSICRIPPVEYLPLTRWRC